MTTENLKRITSQQIKLYNCALGHSYFEDEGRLKNIIKSSKTGLKVFNK